MPSSFLRIGIFRILVNFLESRSTHLATHLAKYLEKINVAYSQVLGAKPKDPPPNI